MKRLVVELDDKLHNKIKTKAIKLGKSMRKIFMELLKEWIEK